MFMTFLLFQRNLYIVLARGKGPKNSVYRDLFKTKNPKILRGLCPLSTSMALSWTHWEAHSALQTPSCVLCTLA